jgi:hypothetical protein
VAITRLEKQGKEELQILQDISIKFSNLKSRTGIFMYDKLQIQIHYKHIFPDFSV